MTDSPKKDTSAQGTDSPQDQSAEDRTIYDESLPKGQVSLFETTDKTRAYLKITSTSSEDQFLKDEILEIINES